MAHQHPEDAEEQPSDPVNQDSTQQPLPPQAQSYTGNNRRRHVSFFPARSTPIAIRRSSSSQDDDSDDDSSVEETHKRTTAAAHSLPSRLLRAPWLGSIPTNDDTLCYQNMLPPPMNLAETKTAATPGPNYGSLRESHMRGRFQDGPSSYRDSRTGDIHRIQHQVRFLDTEAPSISIGERMMQSRQKKKAGADKKEPTSSLAAMLETSELAADEEETGGASEQNQMVMEGLGSSSHSQQRAFFDEEVDSERSHMLSTSLTGLEVLQGGLRPSVQRSMAPPPAVLMEELEELPRDTSGSNALLSRSFSDPTPHMRPRLGPVLRSPLQSSQGGSLIPPANMQGLQLLPAAAAAMNVGFYQASARRPSEHQPAQLPPNDDYENADTEGAFDMDME